MKIRLRNGVVGSLIAKIIKSSVRKKFGCDVSIEINGLCVDMSDGRTKISLDMDATIDNDEFAKILKTAGLD